MPHGEAAFHGSREKIIPEGSFVPVLEEAAAGLLALRDEVRAGKDEAWTRKFVSRLIREVHGLRTVLNDYGAQQNREYAFLVEVVAGIRGFATVTYVLKHLRERYVRSPLHGTLPDEEEFLVETDRTFDWAAQTLRCLFYALLEECEQFGIDLPPPTPSAKVNGIGAPPAVRERLPSNLDEEEIAVEGSMVAQIAASFLRVADQYAAVAPSKLASYRELSDCVLGRLDEEQARTFQSLVHAIQSRYDTYIQHTAPEGSEPDLRRIRAVISIVLHLFEITTHLVHFYERHENDIRSASAKERIAEIVDKHRVLDRAVNYAFRSAGWFLDEGRRIATRLIPEFTVIEEVTFAIPPDVRLHIRPAALIAAVVNHHGTPVQMRMSDGECDASSVTEVIFLAGTNPDAREVSFRGDREPLGDLARLFEVGLSDDGHQRILERLPYLSGGQPGPSPPARPPPDGAPPASA